MEDILIPQNKKRAIYSSFEKIFYLFPIGMHLYYFLQQEKELQFRFLLNQDFEA